ncbi:apoptotic chromatin condensation inducer in the nucleus [Daktulosphaira vitifoliae]|uniref:apoptotic chromatin condensation inducer in the nucleus n=1 Tax=Daktulosphaira vitifoliae TaxID=58002 RepID=UPI0021AA01A2|nr:apoptotic chromatin condensation inducer in the nucleus [Daktulosphaira vitifoliae]
MSKRTGRKPKRTSRRRTRRHSSTSEPESVEEVPVKTRSSSRIDENEKKVALTIKLPKPDTEVCNDDTSTGMWKVECSNGSDGDIQKLKISLRRSPKDLIKEQAAEAKYAAVKGGKEEAAGSSSVNSSVLDGSVTNYLDSSVTKEKVEQDESNNANQEEEKDKEEPEIPVETVSSIIQETVIIQANITKSSDITPSEVLTPQSEDTVVENICTDNIKINVANTNETIENISEPIMISEANDLSNAIQQHALDSSSKPLDEKCKLSETTLDDKVEHTDTTILLESKEETRECLPESVESIISNLNDPKTIEKSNHSNTINKIQLENVNKIDVNDSEQMEDVVQLTVESPDLVDEDESKPVEELNYVSSSENIITQDKISNDTKTEHVETFSDTSNSHFTHPKRKWGSCKTRIPITINPFTLGLIIESNGDSIGDNGEYRSEEGEIQKTDSEDNNSEEEGMEINDTMMIDHETVDYEAPDDEDKVENEENKSDKSLEEPNVVKEPIKKKSMKRMSSVIHITNLVRPFTVGQLRDLLQRTGKIVPNGFWIDAIKSQCIVEYENEDQAIETVYALNESQWPSTNPKFLKVVFSDKEELNKALNGSNLDQTDRHKISKVEKLRVQIENHNTILREWDKGKLEDMNGDDEKPNKRKLSDGDSMIKDKKIRKDEKDSSDKKKKSKSKTPERVPTKSLDELFKKTKTTPTLYWSPLSAEEIAEKEDQRRKHLADMERSLKTDRRRRDNNNYPRRR